MTDSFALDPRLAADGPALGNLRLCHVRLVDDARFPWLVMIPARARLVEIIDLPAEDRALLMEEIATVSSALKAIGGVEKLNVAALGNVVPQLHVHIVGRAAGDAAWPGPVFGTGPREPYEPGERAALEARLKTALGL
ncbi:HIT family protein [Azorhizobium oxalatiphilum]|uniref:HIT family protein n=1 Tax=Azorhizobium oxalatiphilum TaxID=980631 RepID=A0A917FGE2_9HYPH|nr:HIT family protein [Azorhizobium oxalatiphilum]GGF76950.1 HIT family protein [Azorhizobium oxalatiphilum]